MQYTLVVSDMDGTLLRQDHTLSQRSIEAVRRYEAAGGRFALATGRGVAAVDQYLRQLRLRTPLVLLNGCLVYDPVTGADLLLHHLSQEALDACWPILDEYKLSFIVHGPRRATTREIDQTMAEHLRHDGIMADVNPDLGARNCGKAVKVLIIADPAVLDLAEAAIRQTGAHVRTVRSYETYLEILPPAAGKGAALEFLLRHLQVPRERSLALGDFLNDLDLLTTAGLGVAMANAHPALKQVAGRLTASNVEDGVAQVLEALVAGRPAGVAPGQEAG